MPFELDTRIPQSYKFGPDIGTRMAQSASIANMLAQKDRTQQETAQADWQQQAAMAANQKKLQDDAETKAAFQQATNPDGTIDDTKLIPSLNQISPELAMNYQKTKAENEYKQAFAKQLDAHATDYLTKSAGLKIDSMGQLLSTIDPKDPMVAVKYNAAVQHLKESPNGELWPKNGSLDDTWQGDSTWQKVQVLKGSFDQTKQKLDANIKQQQTDNQAAKDAEAQALKEKEAAEVARHNKAMEDWKNSHQSGAGIQLSQKQNQFDETQWPKLMDKINPLKQSSRSVLGVAASSNMRADRALSILKDPKTTANEIKSLVDTDILAIMKGGVPDAEQLKNGLIKTFGADMQEKLQYMSSNPQEFNNPAVRKRLIDITTGLKAIDNKIIEDAIGIGGASYIPLINRHPDWWAQATKAVTKTAEGMGGEQPIPQTKAHPQDSEAVKWAKQNPNDPRSVKILQMNGAQ